ncbi:MAG: prephenate dehydrogenase [Verrucomicrobiales bacterium]|jgi:prephenate dehydrogenase
MAEKCVAILGPGLLGGSLAMALKSQEPKSRVHIWARRELATQAVTAAGLADFASTDLAAVVCDANLIVLATPVPFMSDLAAQLTKLTLQPDALVTDVGSVKASVVANVGAPLLAAGVTFIGSHPMAGSEQAGIEAARPDLFDGAACIVTPEPHTDPTQLDRLVQWWSALSCRVTTMVPQQHDEMIGRISHLPHIAACALTLASLKNDPAISQLAGQGFRDSTRVAAGDADLWLGILRENRAAVLDPLRDLQSQLGRVLAILEKMDDEQLITFLRDAKEMRDGCPQAK